MGSAGDARAATGDRLFTPAFVTLALADLAYFTSFGVTVAVLPSYAAGPIGADAFQVGVAVAAFSFTALVLRPFAGREADRRGRRPLLVGGAALFAVVTLAHLAVDALPLLVGLRVVLGIGEAMFFVASFAAIADLAPPGRTGEALSYNSLALYVGIALGPGLGQWLIAIGGFGLGWVGAAMLAAIAAGLAFRLPETSTAMPGTGSGPLVLVHPAAIVPAFGLLCGVAAMVGFLWFVPLYAPTVGLAGPAGPALVLGGVVVVARTVFARLPDRLPAFPLGAGALAAVAIGLVIASVVPTAVGLHVGAAVLALGVAFMTPALFAAMFSRVPSSERGAASGTASLFIDVGDVVGPSLVGGVAALSTVGTAYGVMALVPALGAAGLAVVASRQASPAARAPARRS